MVSMEWTSGLQTAQSRGWGKMYKETSRAGIPLGEGAHIYIFGSESTQKIKHELEGQAYLFTLGLFQKSLKVSMQHP